MVGPKKLSELGSTDYNRWLNVSKGAVRVSTEEIGECLSPVRAMASKRTDNPG
jgi:hypothetical protein